MSTNALGTAPSSATRCGCPGGGSGSLELINGNTIRTPKYDIIITKDEVKVLDRATGKFVRVWGDPHIWTGDGDRLGFSTGNLTLDLDDGTKITIEPTDLEANGTSFVDRVGVMNGEKAMVVDGVHDAAGPRFGSIGNNSAEVDQMMADGTVLRTAGEVDDLVSARSGEEFIGVNEGARSDEFDVSNQGGVSKYDYAHQKIRDEICEIEEQIGNIQGRTSGGDVFARLFEILARIESQFERKVNELDQLGQDKEKKSLLEDKKAKLEEILNDPDTSEAEKTKIKTQIDGVDREIARFGNLDTKIKKVEFEIQRLEQERQQVITLQTNLLRSDFDTKLRIINNIGGR